MPDYKAPLRDIRFLVHDVFDYSQHYAASGYPDISQDLIDPVLEEAARFCEGVLAPTWREGDEIGTHLQDGQVVTPASYKAAFDGLVAGQWMGMCSNPAFGGQGLPHSLGMVFHEMAESANMPFCATFTLTQGAMRALEAHGSDALKNQYLPNMVSGKWTGTMCLTEAHAGSDLGMLRTRAEPDDDGSYTVTGEKIFITWADHDLSENIIHLVLAKLPDAPPGPKGISLFLVPKRLVNEDGSPGEANRVQVAKLEEKMGLKSSPTSVFVLEGAKGWLVGEPHNGLAAMFTMMNTARLDVAFEGLGLAQLAHQGAVEYARERLQMRAPTGPVAPDKPADPIIVHPDVRRMLLTQKALVEGCRALGYYTATQLDIALHPQDDPAKQQHANDRVALMTPICKGFFTERASEVADLGIQCFGGHGYIREWGMEQIARDVRITRIYEGTNGIQAIDLIKRKVLGNQGRLLEALVAEIEQDCARLGKGALADVASQVSFLMTVWQEITADLQARSDKADVPMSAAFEYLEFSGYAVLAWCWLKMMAVAREQRDAGRGDADFLDAKLTTGQFYFERILPRTESLLRSLGADTESLMSLTPEQFWMP